jgi:multicomponent Na+:H+ antiporter subunit A
VLIETIFGLLFVACTRCFPATSCAARRRGSLRAGPRIRNAVIASLSGIVTTLVVWSALSREIPRDGMAERHVALVEEAHGKDVVTVILADFRGLDTFVEVTVVAVAMLAVAMVLRGRLRP